MGSLVTDEGVVFVELEPVEGTYQAEQSGATAVEVLSDGLELQIQRELLTRNNRTGTVETVASLLGTKSCSGTIPVELKAAGGGTPGARPETGNMWEALLGGVRSGTASTSKTGHTVSRIEIEDADISKYSVGDIVRAVESATAGEDHVSPITAVDATVGAAFIDLLVPRASAFTDNVVVAGFITFFHQSNAPSLSVTEYIGGKKRKKFVGIRPTGAELGNFSTGALADVSFTVEGLTYLTPEIATPLFTPVYDSDNGVTPPPILNSKVFQEGSEIAVNNLGVTLTNTLAFLTSTASVNGRTNSRITKFEVGGSMNPYASDSDITNFENFDCNKKFSIFARTQSEDCLNPGVFKDGIAFYIPNARNSELGVGNEDGVVTDEISFTGHKTLGNDSFFISFH